MSNDIRALVQSSKGNSASQLGNLTFAGLIAAIVMLGVLFGAILPNLMSQPSIAPVKISQSPVPATFATVSPDIDPDHKIDQEERAREWVKQADLPRGEERFDQMNLYNKTMAKLQGCSRLSTHRHMHRVRSAYRERNHERFLEWKNIRESHARTLSKMQNMNQAELALTLASGRGQRSAIESMAEINMMLSGDGVFGDMTANECSRLNTEVQTLQYEVAPLPTD